ncbi:glycoside hydrolase family 12 [Catenovulum sp. SM1970]|uniref:GH12 family glycosyl hydrolase domain-containing protein n=1 Tax=Marinifaba aquimaris TaxID=2741323 RepID=UPI001573F21B|nr:glycoside hydrolase family 12 [Marinifaba aquimaris]NTS76806.1 glycoside hydrolase family 12 [Marinifaba aquimaris]
MKYLLLGTLVLLTACSTKQNDEKHWIKPESTTLSCDHYFSHSSELGVLINNVWNKNAAHDKPWSQCIEQRVVDKQIQQGWSWSWPSDQSVIYAYPQIRIGASPWAPEPKYNADFPLQIAQLSELTISHELEIDTNGEHNTATSMWLMDEPYQGITANKSVIAAEVMIWTYETSGHFNPAGRKHSEIKIGGQVWEVWYKSSWYDMSGEHDNRWAYLAFRAKQSSMKATIPALQLLNYAIDNNLLANNLYIADIELGNEVMKGSGITWVKNFEVSYQ